MNIEGTDVSEMKVKRRLQIKPAHMRSRKSPEVKIKAINALYGSENTLESLRNSYNLNAKKARKTG